MRAFQFTSCVPRDQRQALERLLFFNGGQARVERDIIEAIDRYGPPEIYDDGRALRVRVGSMPDVQCLFAIEGASGRPIGVAVYVRADLEHVTVLHVGVSEDYSAGGLHDDASLLLRLVREVRRSSRRMKGVRRLALFYGSQRDRGVLADG